MRPDALHAALAVLTVYSLTVTLVAVCERVWRKELQQKNEALTREVARLTFPTTIERPS